MLDQPYLQQKDQTVEIVTFLGALVVEPVAAKGKWALILFFGCGNHCYGCACLVFAIVLHCLFCCALRVQLCFVVCYGQEVRVASVI